MTTSSNLASCIPTQVLNYSRNNDNFGSYYFSCHRLGSVSEQRIQLKGWFRSCSGYCAFVLLNCYGNHRGSFQAVTPSH